MLQFFHISYYQRITLTYYVLSADGIDKKPLDNFMRWLYNIR